MANLPLVHSMDSDFHRFGKAPINSDTINALAMLLSRREESPQALTREQVDRFLNRLGRELIARIEARDFKIRFRNTLSAIAGLFRWRKREPFALLAARDPVAAQLRETLTRAEEMLERGHDIQQKEQKIDLVRRIIDLLDGEGDPEILRRIEFESATDLDGDRAGSLQ